MWDEIINSLFMTYWFRVEGYFIIISSVSELRLKNES